VSGFIPDLGGGFGVIFVEIAGIQNGDPNAIVLYTEWRSCNLSATGAHSRQSAA
jgi:hypothetical protein